MSEYPYHIPALLSQCMDGLKIRPDGIYVDVTFGGGGHSREILKRLGEKGHLYAFDQDADAQANLIDDARFTFVRSNFRYLKNFMRYYGVDKVDGILADLGVSSHHLDEAGRGFSFRFDGNLDMRMNQKGTASTAADVLNSYSEEDLADVFRLYGELKEARRIATSIVRHRADRPFATVQDLLEVLKPSLNKEREKKQLAQIFQALRIEVNREMDVLKRFLQQSLELLAPNGRIAIISYHSLEDRLVKNFFRSGNVNGDIEKDFYGKVHTPFVLVNNKVIVPDEEECNLNPRSRSAKLRVAEKKEDAEAEE